MKGRCQTKHCDREEWCEGRHGEAKNANREYKEKNATYLHILGNLGPTFVNRSGREIKWWMEEMREGETR